MTAPNQPDPWKSFRGVMAGTLILEVIVVLLASFSLFYLWFLNRVNRHYGAK